MNSGTVVIDGLTHHFGRTVVLNDVSFHLDPGQVCALAGANGSGKSTLLNLCLGFLRPSSGRVTVGGFDVALEPIQAKRVTAYVPEVARLYGGFSAVENMVFFERLMGRRRDERECLEVLAKFGLSASDARRSTSRFSKGMRQKVSIALGLIKDASIFLLDEPTSGLDPQSSEECRNILRQLGDSGKTVLFTTHDLAHAKEIADETLVLDCATIITSKDYLSGQVLGSDA